MLLNFKVTGVFVFQPKNDFIPFIEGLKEYSGMLSTYPDVLQVHKVIFLSLEVLLMLLQAKLGFALPRCYDLQVFTFPFFFNKRKASCLII